MALSEHERYRFEKPIKAYVEARRPPHYWGGLAYLERVVGGDEKQLDEYSPINYVDEIEAAVMLIHGVDDRRVPVAHAKAMQKQLK